MLAGITWNAWKGGKNTKALITFGTPYRGSLNALDGLANGIKKGPRGLIDITTLGRQFKSLYQLLPIYECYDAGDGKAGACWRIVRYSEC